MEADDDLLLALAEEADDAGPPQEGPHGGDAARPAGGQPGPSRPQPSGSAALEGDDLLLALAEEAHDAGLAPAASHGRAIDAARPAGGQPGPSRPQPSGSAPPRLQPGVIPVRPAPAQPAALQTPSTVHRIVAFQAPPKPGRAQPGFADVGQGSSIERMSGLKVKNPLVSSAQVEARLNDKAVVRLAHVRSRHRATGLEDSWVTIGVLGEKSKPRESQGGRLFSIWKLTDLDQACVSLFLFGSAHADLSKEPVGILVAVFRPKVKADGDFALSVESSEQVWVLGMARDFGYCKATKKDGEPCRMPVNMAACAYCSYHVQREYNKLKPARRGDFQESNLKTAFRQPRGKGLQWQPGVFEAPQRAQQTLARLSGAQLRGVADRAYSRGSAAGARYVRTVADPEAAAAAQQERVTLAEGRRPVLGKGAAGLPALVPPGRGGSAVLPLKRQVSGQPAAGSRQPAAGAGSAARPAARAARPPAGTVLLEEDDSFTEDGARSRAAELLRAAGERGGAQARGGAPGSKAPGPAEVPGFLRAGLDRLEAREQAAAQRSGPEDPEDAPAAGGGGPGPSSAGQAQACGGGGGARAPLASRPALPQVHRPPPPQQQHKQQQQRAAAAWPAAAGNASGAGGANRSSLLSKLGMGGKKPRLGGKPAQQAQQQASAFEAAFGGVIREMEASGPVQRGSKYRELVGDEEHDRLMAVAAALQQKDDMAQRMDAIKQLDVKAWRCKVCDYTAEYRRPECSAHVHACERVTAQKRWWQCEGCGHRFETVGVRLPRRACARCQHPGADFKSVSMFRPPKAPLEHQEAAVAAREHLKPRGMEQKWVS